MKVSQAAINAALPAARAAINQESSFYSGMISDAMLLPIVVATLTAGFGTVPSPTITGPAAHPAPTAK